MRLLVFGSRSWVDVPDLTIVRALDALTPRPSVVIEGEARGADSLARLWASSRGVPVERFPVDNAKDGPWPAAGHRRNARMHREGKPDAAIGFISGLVGEPLSRGSAGMAEICKRAGTPLRIVREDGEEVMS